MSEPTERLQVLMRQIKEPYWDDPFTIGVVESGESRQAVRTGVGEMGWDGHMQGQFRMLAGVHLDHPTTWASCTSEPHGVEQSWHYANNNDAGPFAALEMAHIFNFGEAAVSCDWLPPLLREWRHPGPSGTSNWSTHGHKVTWKLVEAVPELTFKQVEFLTRPPVRKSGPGSGHDPQTCLAEVVSVVNISLNLFAPLPGENRGTYRSLPVSVITTPKLTVTTTIVAAVGVNRLVRPVKLFAIRQHRPQRTGEHWDEIIGWTKITENPDRKDQTNAYDGRVWFRRSYRITDLARWQGFITFDSRSNGSRDPWQLFEENDLACHPPMVTREVDWHPTIRDGHLDDLDTINDRLECARTAPAQLDHLVTYRLRHCSPSQLMTKLDYGLLMDPPRELADLIAAY